MLFAEFNKINNEISPYYVSLSLNETVENNIANQKCEIYFLI